MNRQPQACEHVWVFKDVQFRDDGTDITTECQTCGALAFLPDQTENRPPLP